MPEVAVQQRLLGVPKACAPLVAVESSSSACEAIIREHIEAALENLRMCRATELVTIRKAARRLGIGERPLRRAVRLGDISVYLLGARPWLRWSDVLAWLEAQRTYFVASRRVPPRGRLEQKRVQGRGGSP